MISSQHLSALEHTRNYDCRPTCYSHIPTRKFSTTHFKWRYIKELMNPTRMSTFHIMTHATDVYDYFVRFALLNIKLISLCVVGISFSMIYIARNWFIELYNDCIQQSSLLDCSKLKSLQSIQYFRVSMLVIRLYLTILESAHCSLDCFLLVKYWWAYFSPVNCGLEAAI